MTNFEKIKAMSVEEIAKFLNNNDCQYCSMSEFSYCNSKCSDGRILWLEQEANDE